MKIEIKITNVLRLNRAISDRDEIDTWLEGRLHTERSRKRIIRMKLRPLVCTVVRKGHVHWNRKSEQIHEITVINCCTYCTIYLSHKLYILKWHICYLKFLVLVLYVNNLIFYYKVSQSIIQGVTGKQHISKLKSYWQCLVLLDG